MSDDREANKLQDCDDRGSFSHRLSSVDPLNYRFSPFNSIFCGIHWFAIPDAWIGLEFSDIV